MNPDRQVVSRGLGQYRLLSKGGLPFAPDICGLGLGSLLGRFMDNEGVDWVRLAVYLRVAER